MLRLIIAVYVIMLFNSSIFKNKESSLVRESQCDGGRVDWERREGVVMVGVTIVTSWVGGSYLDSPPPPRTGHHPTMSHYSECALCVLTQISSDWIDE